MTEPSGLLPDDPGPLGAGPEVTVLGLGNVLVGDDGAGLAALAELSRRHRLPPGVRLLDGGVLGLHLLGLLEDAEHLLVLDAVRLGRRPGELVRLEGEQVPAAFTARMSPHELGFTEVLAAARVRGRTPARLVLWGIQAEEVSSGIGLSIPVAAAIPGLVEAAAAELRCWGVPVPVRPAPPATGGYPDAVLGLTRGALGAVGRGGAGRPSG